MRSEVGVGHDSTDAVSTDGQVHANSERAMSLTHSPIVRGSLRLGKRGFTLIEILVVIVVIAILASLVAPDILKNVGDAKSNTAKNQIVTLGGALNSYYLDNGRFPTTEQGLEALNVMPTIDPPNNWRGPYLEGALPLDPWQRPYIYVSPGEYNPRRYDLYSYGADGQPGGDGDNADITSWN